ITNENVRHYLTANGGAIAPPHVLEDEKDVILYGTKGVVVKAKTANQRLMVEKAAENDTLQHTINYEILYQIAVEVMKTPALLLEHIAYQMIQKVFAAFGTAEVVEVVVRKHNPPIGGVCNASKIVLKMKREN
ncbi:MAG: dihydroneopterin aldolase, partial [Thermoflexibacteraceae bacterium]